MDFRILKSELFPEDGFALVGSKNVVIYLNGKFKEMDMLEYQNLMGIETVIRHYNLGKGRPQAEEGE